MQTFLKLNDALTYTIIQFLKIPHKSNLLKCESTSKIVKFTKSLNNKKQVKKMSFLEILLTFLVFTTFMIFQLIVPVLLIPTNYCFQDQVTPPSDRLWLVNQPFTKLNMVYSDFLWSPPDMVSVLIMDSRKYGHHKIYLYFYHTKNIYILPYFSQLNMGFYFPWPI